MKLTNFYQELLPFPEPWLPSSALVSESAKRNNPGVLTQWRRSHEIPSWKYHSSRRHDQLQACARLFDVAGFLFPNELHPLTAWQGEIIEYFNVAGWWFPTGYNCTVNLGDVVKLLSYFEGDTPNHTPGYGVRVHTPEQSSHLIRSKVAAHSDPK